VLAIDHADRLANFIFHHYVLNRNPIFLIEPSSKVHMPTAIGAEGQGLRFLVFKHTLADRANHRIRPGHGIQTTQLF
jgi:hypothetical protein